MRGLWRIAAVAIAATLAGVPAAGAYQAGGMPLADVMALAKPYPNLVLLIRLQLVRANLKREQVTCASERVPDAWARLAGQRHAPYTCVIGRRTLVVTATQTWLDAAGHKVKPNDPDIARKAARLTERNLKWTWQ